MNFPHESTTYNTAYLDDLEYSIQINRWLLKPLGAWPPSDTTSRTERILSKLLKLTCHSLIAFTVVPSTLHIVLEKEDIQTKLQIVGPTSHWLMGGVNYCSLLSRSEKIRSCVEHMETDWRSVKRAEDREVMLRNARFGRMVASFSAIFMHIGVFSYSIVTGMTSTVAVVDNETIVMQRLPCPSYDKFIDARFSPANEIVVGLQVLSGFIVTSITVGACGMAAVFATHACGQLNVVMLWLDDFVDAKEKEQRSVQRRLASIVQLHLRTLSFISRIEDIMHQICLVELVGCTMNLCMLGYYCITEWKNQDTKGVVIYCILFMSMMFNIFIFCYIGDILTEQCKKVGERAYLTNWYRLPHKTALGLILIISRSSAVIKITAGKLIQLSISTFGDVIKTAMAYLNMLRAADT